MKKWLPVFLLVLSLFIRSVLLKEVSALADYNSVDWESANEVCPLLGTSTTVESSDTLRTDQFYGQFWIGAFVEYTPWIKMIGCYEFAVSDLERASVNRGSQSPNDVLSCISQCDGFQTFALSANDCYCVSEELTKDTKCQPNVCDGSEADFCGTTIRQGAIGIVIYQIDTTEFLGTEDCVAATFAGTTSALRVLFDQTSVIPCTESHGYVCRTVESFPKDHEVVYYENPRGSWHDAVEECVNKTYNIVEFSNLWFSRRIVLPKVGSNYWVGIFRRHKQRFGNVADFVASSNPRNCVAVNITEDGGMEMVIRNCSDQLPSLCEAGGLPFDYVIIIIMMTVLVVAFIIAVVCIRRKCLSTKAVSGRSTWMSMSSKSSSQCNDNGEPSVNSESSTCHDESSKLFKKSSRSTSKKSGIEPKGSLKFTNSSCSAITSLFRKTSGSLNLTGIRNKMTRKPSQNKSDREVGNIINLYSFTKTDDSSVNSNTKDYKNGQDNLQVNNPLAKNTNPPSDGDYFVLEKVTRPNGGNMAGPDVFHISEQTTPVSQSVENLHSYTGNKFQPYLPTSTPGGFKGASREMYSTRPRANTSVPLKWKEKNDLWRPTALHKTYSQPTNQNSIDVNTTSSKCSSATGDKGRGLRNTQKEVHVSVPTDTAPSGEYFILEKLDHPSKGNDIDREMNLQEYEDVILENQIFEKSPTSTQNMDQTVTPSFYQDVEDLPVTHAGRPRANTSISNLSRYTQKSLNSKTNPLHKTLSQAKSWGRNFNSKNFLGSLKNKAWNSIRKRDDIGMTRADLSVSDDDSQFSKKAVFNVSEQSSQSVYDEIEIASPNFSGGFRARATTSISNFWNYKKKKTGGLPLQKTFSQPSYLESVSEVPPPLPSREPHAEVAEEKSATSNEPLNTSSSCNEETKSKTKEIKRGGSRKTVRFCNQVDRLDDRYDHVQVENKSSGACAEASNTYDTMESVRNYIEYNCEK